MIHPQNYKFQQMIRPVDTGAGTATDVEVDTRGYDYLTVIVQLGNVAANMGNLKLQESDSSGSGEADFTGSAWTTPTSSDDNKLYVAFVDLRKRKRYISIVATGTGITLVSACAILSRAEVTPISATERGAAEQLIL